MNPPGIPQVGLDYLRTQATALMRSRVQIQTPAVPTYNPVTGIAVGSPGVTGYIGVAHIHPAKGGAAIYQGDQLTELVQVQVSIPWDADPIPHEDDQVLVLQDEDDRLLNRTLRIVDVSAGGVGFAVRLLTCTYVEAGPFDPLA